MGKLTPKQALFVEEYLIDYNATQAAIRAGYSVRSAYSIGQATMCKHVVAEAIQKARDARSKEAGIDAAYVLRQAAKLHERCMGSKEPVLDDEGNHALDENGEKLYNIYEFNPAGAAKGLELVGKHVDIEAFSERHKHDHNVNVIDRVLGELPLPYVKDASKTTH